MDSSEIVQRAIRMMSHQLGANIRIRSLSNHGPLILANSNQLVQVFINLLQNSIDAIRERAGKDPGLEGTIDISVRDEGGRALIIVRDNGIGIPPEDIQRIFDPFFTSKEVGQGMGLGLSITHQILQSHGVSIDVQSRPCEFTEIHLLFPAPESHHREDPEYNISETSGQLLLTVE